MNTIVMDLEALAVTEYTPALTGISGDYETSADGLLKAGGSADGSLPIPASFSFGLMMDKSTKLQFVDNLYLLGTSGSLSATITTAEGNAYTYQSIQRHGAAARFQLGRGIRSNYLKFAVSGSSKTPMILDVIELVTSTSSNRKM